MKTGPLENEKVHILFSSLKEIFLKSVDKNHLNAYLGYVVPKVTYCSQVWFPNKSQMKEIEKLQKIATKWILSEKQS